MYIEPTKREFLILFLAHPTRNPEIRKKALVSMLHQTEIENSNIIELPKLLSKQDFLHLALRFRRNTREFQISSHELFNYAIVEMINHAFSKRTQEKFFCVWFDDIVILDSEALAKAKEELKTYEGVGIIHTPVQLECFTGWFVYRMEEWKEIDWATLKQVYNFPQTYMAFQHHYFKDKKTKVLNVPYQHLSA